MPASVVEQALAHIKTVLLAATAAGNNVERGREDGVSPDEMPAINIRRGNVPVDAYGTRSSQLRITVELDIWASGPDWETAADAVHMSAHVALFADSVLRPALIGCTGVDTVGASGETQAGHLTARYELLLFVQTADLTTPLA